MNTHKNSMRKIGTRFILQTFSEKIIKKKLLFHSADLCLNLIFLSFFSNSLGLYFKSCSVLLGSVRLQSYICLSNLPEKLCVCFQFEWNKFCEKLWLIKLKAVSSPKGDRTIYSASFALTSILERQNRNSIALISIFGLCMTEGHRERKTRNIDSLSVISVHLVIIDSFDKNTNKYEIRLNEQKEKRFQLTRWLNKRIHWPIVSSVHVIQSNFFFSSNSNSTYNKSKTKMFWNKLVIFPYFCVELSQLIVSLSRSCNDLNQSLSLSRSFSLTMNNIKKM